MLFFFIQTPIFFFYTEVETKFFMSALLRSLYGGYCTCSKYMYKLYVDSVCIRSPYIAFSINFFVRWIEIFSYGKLNVFPML